MSKYQHALFNINMSIIKNLSVTYNTIFLDPTDSSSISSGGVVIKGGLGIAKNLNISGNINALSNINITDNLNVIGITSLATSSTIGNLTLGDGSIIDDSGDISFGNENLVTTGTFGAGIGTFATGSIIGNLTFANGLITDSSDDISFGNENLITTGTIGAGIATFATTSTIGNLTFSNGLIEDASNDISFNDNNLITTGILTVSNNVNISHNLTVSQNLNVDGVTNLATNTIIGNLTLGDGSIIDDSGDISFGNENLVTTGTFGAGVATFATNSSIGNLTFANGSITDSSQNISFGNENLVTTGKFSIGTTTTTYPITVYDSDASLKFSSEYINASTGVGTGVAQTFNCNPESNVPKNAFGIRRIGLHGVSDFTWYAETTNDSTIVSTTDEIMRLTSTGALSISNMTISNGLIEDSSNDISFNDNNLITTGTFGSGVATLASASTIGNLTLSNGSITDSSGDISFGNENISTTGNCNIGDATQLGTNEIQSGIFVANGSNFLNTDTTLTKWRVAANIGNGTGFHAIIHDTDSAAAAGKTARLAFGMTDTTGVCKIGPQIRGRSIDSNAVQQDLYFDTDSSTGGNTPANTMIMKYTGDIIIANRLGINATPNVRLDIIDADDAKIVNINATHASYAKDLCHYTIDRAGSTAYSFLKCTSNTDNQFLLDGDGTGYSDLGWTTPAADYAEYYESNTGYQLEFGKCVVLTVSNSKVSIIRLYDNIIDNLSDIIGITRPKNNCSGSSFIGNNNQAKWKNKYITDGFGCFEMENYNLYKYDVIEKEEQTINESYGDTIIPMKIKKHVYEVDNVPDNIIIPDDAEIITQQRKKLNPEWNKDQVYISYKDREEKVLIGLLGQIPVLKSEPKKSGWRLCYEITNEIEMWQIN